MGNVIMKSSAIFGKKSTPEGVTPSIILCNPKYSANVGAAVRAASCFDAKQVWWTGNRFNLAENDRLPREERMKGYKDVELRQFDQPFDHFPNAVPVAIELLPNSENLVDFVHPENAVYVFGPEDGSIPPVVRRFCHRFVSIPSKHCLNLAAAVYIVLYDRVIKQYKLSGTLPVLDESRGFVDTNANEDIFGREYKNGVAFK